MKIGNREVGPGLAPYITAEIGANHQGSLERCLQTIEAAKRSGADGVKFQAYTADTITLDSSRDEFYIKDGPWAGKRLWDLYKECETPFEWFPKIAARANALGIDWFCSVFDPSSVDMLERLGCPAYKIASFEIVDLPLIRYAAKTGKPVIISTGMASEDEITAAHMVTQHSIMLHCVSGYPAKASDYNLRFMPSLAHYYGVSDHTLGLEVPIAATVMGACMIEKHFKLEGSDSEDEAFSLAPEAFARMVKAIMNTWAAMQPGESKSEAVHKPYRRSLFVVKDVKKGEAFTHENVRSIRPGNGLPPDWITEIVGLKATRDITRGEPLSKEMLDG